MKTQDKDREELKLLLTEFNEWTKNTFTTSLSNERFNLIFEKLLRWKRGDKWWCEHLEWSITHWTDTEKGTVEHTSILQWQFCPLCGAKRPGEK